MVIVLGVTPRRVKVMEHAINTWFSPLREVSSCRVAQALMESMKKKFRSLLDLEIIHPLVSSWKFSELPVRKISLHQVAHQLPQAELYNSS